MAKFNVKIFDMTDNVKEYNMSCVDFDHEDFPGKKTFEMIDSLIDDDVEPVRLSNNILIFVSENGYLQGLKENKQFSSYISSKNIQIPYTFVGLVVLFERIV